MRTILISALIAIILSSCTSVKHENEELKMKVDSLNNLSNLKDSAMNYFLKSMDEIDYNLQIIKEKENLITISSQNVNGELNQSQKDRINEDILMIYDLLQQNKEKLANMNHKFNQADIFPIRPIIFFHCLQRLDPFFKIGVIISTIDTTISTLNKIIV